MADRYGPAPLEVSNLLRFSLLKTMAQRAGVESIDRRQNFANIKFHPGSKIDPLRLMESRTQFSGCPIYPGGRAQVAAQAVHQSI